MNRFSPHVHRARPLNGFESGPNLAENKIEYVLLTNSCKFYFFFSELGSAFTSVARQEQLRSGCSPGTKSLHKGVTIRIPGLPVKQGEVFLETTRILSGIQFTTHFIEFFVVETKRFVGSTVHVILTQQTCSQCSSRDAESKRRALENNFSERICYKFTFSKRREDWDSCLCTFWVLAKRDPLRNGDFRKKTCFARRNNQNLALRSCVLFVSTQKLH